MADGEARQITYTDRRDLDLAQVIDLYHASTLGQRRPVDDIDRMREMMTNANLVITAWDGGRLVGIARCLTDHSYVAYLSDLAVDVAYQKQGIGRELMRHVQEALHPKANVILLAAPAAVNYYPRIGMEQHPSAWIVQADQELR